MSLSLYDIAQNRELLAKMTLEAGESLTYEQQINRLASKMKKRRQSPPSVPPF